MRVYKDGVEATVNCLGEVPEINNVRQALINNFDLTDRTFETTEPVFNKCLRIVATNQFFQRPQLHSVAARKDELLTITTPLVEWIRGIYPNCVPVLIQCATVEPKKHLFWHVDAYLYQDVSHKIHFPVITNDDAFYEAYLGEEQHSHHFKTGYAYEINNILPHRVINRGATARTHIIIDVMDQEVLDGFLRDGINFHHTHHSANKQAELAWASKFRSIQ